MCPLGNYIMSSFRNFFESFFKAPQASLKISVRLPAGNVSSIVFKKSYRNYFFLLRLDFFLQKFYLPVPILFVFYAGNAGLDIGLKIVHIILINHYPLSLASQEYCILANE